MIVVTEIGLKKLIKTLRVRVKDKHAIKLTRQAQQVNLIWNYCNELSYRFIVERNKFLSEYEFQPYLKGSSKELGLNSQTIQKITKEYVNCRNKSKKRKLAWRKSKGSRRSLGWVPIQTGCAKYRDEKIYFHNNFYDIWDHYDLSQYKFLTASFNEDARGRWYFNVQVEVQQQQSTATKSVGVDLGLKDIATCSDGTKLINNRWYKMQEQKLGLAQRANKKNRVRAIHAKIKNCRKDSLHKFSRRLVNENALIVVGNISTKGLVKTKMAKSVLDAGWGMLKIFLNYKCAYAGNIFMEVNEKYTTQTCSYCHEISDNSPKGRAGLGIREWFCMRCGTMHDRDVNAAKNILALGHERLVGGIVNE